MKTLLLALFVVAVAGCVSSHRYSVNQPVAKKFGAFHTVEVLSFASNVESEAAREAAAEIPDEIVNRLRRARPTGSENFMFPTVTRSTDATEGVLMISGTVLSYDEGSRAKRYLIGMGSGKAYATVQCTFTDKSNGQPVALATFDGELAGGFFGGSAGGAAEGMIEALENFLRDNY